MVLVYAVCKGTIDSAYSSICVGCSFLRKEGGGGEEQFVLLGLLPLQASLFVVVVCLVNLLRTLVVVSCYGLFGGRCQWLYLCVVF